LTRWLNIVATLLREAELLDPGPPTGARRLIDEMISLRA
jgi:hypothetical protein